MGLSRNVQRALVKRGDPVQADNWRQRMVDVVDSRRHGQGDLLRSCPAGNVLCPMGNDFIDLWGFQVVRPPSKG